MTRTAAGADTGTDSDGHINGVSNRVATQDGPRTDTHTKELNQGEIIKSTVPEWTGHAHMIFCLKSFRLGFGHLYSTDPL